MLFPKRPGIQLFITFAVNIFSWLVCGNHSCCLSAKKKKQIVCFNCASIKNSALNWIYLHCTAWSERTKTITIKASAKVSWWKITNYLQYTKDEYIGRHKRPYLPLSCNFIEALAPLCLIWENKNDHHQSFCKSLMMDDGIAFNQDCLIAMSTWPVFFERERKPRVWIYGGAHWSKIKCRSVHWWTLVFKHLLAQ